jgi:hypothetical protein
MKILLFTTILLLSGCAQRYREHSDIWHSDHPLANRYQVHTYPLQIENVLESLPVTFKLDTISGNVWRLEEDAFVSIEVEGKCSAYDMHKSSEKIEADTRKAELIEKMDSIIIPEIDFRQANIRDVITFLQQSSIDFSQDQQGFSMILQLGEEESEEDARTDPDLFSADPFPNDLSPDVTIVTFSALDISLREALDIVCDVANLCWRFSGHAILVSPDIYEDEMITRMYELQPATIDRIHNYRSELASNKDNSGEIGERWKNYFTELGVGFPRYASIKPVPEIGRILVTNTLNNLRVLEAVLESINTFPPIAGRYQLLSNQGEKQNMLVLLDTQIGYTWKYTISDFNDAGMIQSDSFSYMITMK